MKNVLEVAAKRLILDTYVSCTLPTSLGIQFVRVKYPFAVGRGRDYVPNPLIQKGGLYKAVILVQIGMMIIMMMNMIKCKREHSVALILSYSF